MEANDADVKQRRTGETPVDRKISRIATQQRGLITFAQLLAVGLTRTGVQARVDRGALYRLFRGVFLVGHWNLAPGTRELAAVLAVGPSDTFVAHESALIVRGVPLRCATVHVVVVGRKPHPRPGITVHRTTQLPLNERSARDGMPLVSVERALLDLARAGNVDLERVTSEVQARGLTTSARLRAYVRRRAGQPGVERLRALVHTDVHGYTRSAAERLMRRLCRDAGLPQPQVNSRRAGYEVDFVWQPARLVVEVDGFAAHGHRTAFERDRRKQAALVAAGYVVLRFTWRQLTCEPLMVIATIAGAIGSRH